MMQLKMTRRPKLAGWYRRHLAPSRVVLAGVVLAGVAGGLSAQDFDLGIRTDKAAYAPGEAVSATAGLTTRAPGVQGWSYGVKHDPALLTLDSVTFDGTEAQGAIVAPGFFTTEIIVDEGTNTNLGFIQAVVLNLGGANAQVPTDQEFFTLAFAGYTAAADACPAGATEDVVTSIEYTEELGVPGSPPTAINITVAGQAPVPNLVSADVTIECQAGEGPELTLAFNQDDNDLNANTTDTLDVSILLSAQGGSADVQGWSYGVALDPAALTATAGEPGADAAALNGGSGPGFVAYDLDDMSSDGSVRGVTVGVVTAVEEPATEVLSVGDGETKHLDTITVRSTEVLDADATTELAFNGTMGDIDERDPIEVLLVIGGQEVTPDSTSTKTINLIGGVAPEPSFIRADANSDGRVDIADGIWIIGMLFYGTEMTACAPAADSNDDDNVDLSDAIYIFNWRLQPGATPGNLFPAPSAPFPDCGTSPDATAENCPIGSHICTGG